MKGNNHSFAFPNIVLTTGWRDTVTILCPYSEASVESCSEKQLFLRFWTTIKNCLKSWPNPWKKAVEEFICSKVASSQGTTSLKNYTFTSVSKRFCLLFKKTYFQEQISMAASAFSKVESNLGQISEILWTLLIYPN